MKVSHLAQRYIGGLTHAHTVLSNHPGHRESNLTIDRIVSELDRGGLAGQPGSPLRYVLLNEHPSDPDNPHRLGRLSLRGRRILRQRRRPIVQRVPVMYGLEVSLLPGGRTDLTPRLADRCPLVIASAHRLPDEIERQPDQLAELFAEACLNPAVEVLGHPSRFIEDIGLDWKRLFREARSSGTAIEVNFNTFPTHDAPRWRHAFWQDWLGELAKSGASVFLGFDVHNRLQLETFINQWQELDERAGRQDNQLARFLLALDKAEILPERVVTSDYDRFLDWLELDKSARRRLS